MSSTRRSDLRNRVLFVITGLGWGGAESQVIDLATRFRARGWDVAVAVLLDRAERRDALEPHGVPVHTLGMRRGIPDPRAIVRLARLVRAFDPTVVHAHMVHANLLTRLARPLAPVPVVITSGHNTNEGAGWRIAAYRLTDRLTDLTTNVSDAAVERAVARGVAPAGRIRGMPNGVDLGRFRRDEGVRTTARAALGLGAHFVWLTVASFEAQKDYPNLLAAVARLRDDGHDFRVLTVGDGPLRADIEAETARLGISETMVFLGLRDDVPSLMSAADGYVMGSAWEGLPMVLLEASASELPIVATDVGGNQEVIVDGRSGVLVPPRDATALAAGMASVMVKSATVRERWGCCGATHVRLRFDIEGVVDRWIEMYEELFGQNYIK